MPFLPTDFTPPEPLATERFRLRKLSVEDVVRDYAAVMSSRERLWELFGEGWRWPPAEMTLLEDLVDLGWHQKEFELGRSFAYAVVAPDDSEMLGCAYVDPPTREGYDAVAAYWIRTDRLAGGLEEELGVELRAWLDGVWPFTRVGFPGRDVPWAEWRALPRAEPA